MNTTVIIVAVVVFLVSLLLLVALLLVAKAKLTSSGEVTININDGEYVATVYCRLNTPTDPNAGGNTNES